MGGWLFMVLLPIVVVALLVWALSASGRAYWGRGDQADNERSALQLLEERFARGEIDREEFQRRRASASEGPPAGRTWDQRPLSGAGLRGILTASAKQVPGMPRPNWQHERCSGWIRRVAPKRWDGGDALDMPPELFGGPP